LAERPNVYCKLSGLVTEAEYRQWTEEQLQPYFEVVLEAFGPQRLMFGSDWPVCLVASSYKHWVSIVERFCAKLSQPEQERIWSGTAAQAYGLTTHGYNKDRSRYAT
jgi:L-fuconolactonase